MLETATKFEKVFDRMIDDDDKFKKELEDVGGPPTFEDWEDCRLLTTFLQKFYDATTKLSGTSYVTSHLYLSVVVSIENKLNTFISGFDPCDPRYKLTYVTWCYEKHFNLESSKVVELTEKIVDTLNTLSVEYQQLESSNASSSSQNSELEKPKVVKPQRPNVVNPTSPVSSRSRGKSQVIIGSTHGEIYDYFATRFPNLLIEVYSFISKCHDEDLL
ncbi:hypothetical protein MRB53_021979 [Persea americana]|uniref:Uncharacterized protein n=1 Tax=Persea americana TaxID=3435 RepID=A0ACC2L640_PERAE|nr:hypothetical protein MRB53_021979 [Persea americana]